MKTIVLDDLINQTLDSLKLLNYSPRTIQNYNLHYNRLKKIAKQLDIHQLCPELMDAFIKDAVNQNDGKVNILKQRIHMRCVNLLTSINSNEFIDVTRKSGKDLLYKISNPDLIQMLKSFMDILRKRNLSPNTICSYRRIVIYFLIFCEEKNYISIQEIKHGDIHCFISYIYDKKYFRPTTIASALSGLRHFLSLNDHTEKFLIELPHHLSREKKITEIYNEKEKASIAGILEKHSLSKRDTAICLMLMETGLRGVDICNLRLNDIDWEKDIIYIKQKKTGNSLILPLRNSYGNAIADYIVNERPHSSSEYVFIRSLAPFDRLDGEGSSVRVIIKKLEKSAAIENERRISGSRMIRHNVASNMLKSSIPISHISALLGHKDPNIVSIYLSTDEKIMSECTMALPDAKRKGKQYE